MKDQDKTKEQFINELSEMRQRVAELQAANTERQRAEEALRESEELLRATLESTADGILVVGEGGKMVHANTRFAEMWRIPQPVLDSRDDDTLLDFVLDQLQDPEAFLTKVRYLYGSSKEDLDTLQFKDGRVFERFSRPLLQDGMVAGRVWSFRDITERKRTEEKLRESKELFEKTFASQRDAIFILNAKNPPTILECNPVTTEVFDYTHQEMLGRTTAFLHVDEAALRKFQEHLYPAIEECGFLHLPEFEMKRKDGTVFMTEHSVMPLEDEQGKRIGWVSVVRDITERVRAEDALRRRAEELATLQATVLDITAPHDLPTLLQTIVERAARLLDTPSGGLYLCDPDQKEVRCVVSYNTPHDYTGTVLKYGEGAAGIVAQTGEPLVIDDYRTWSGRAAVYEEEQPFTAVLTTPMIWQGQVTGIINVLHDVESRCFTQTDLELLTLFANHAAIAVENARLYEKALQDAKTKSFLLDEVNHRVKNTLVAIIGLLHVEQSYAAMADHATYEAIIQNLTNRVSGLATVHSLLSASEWAPLPLSDLAGQVIKSATQMRPRDKQVFIDAPPSPVRVTPDQAHNLALVINELATNTIKHTLPGRSTARISVRIALEDDVVLFEYRDDGPGYPEDVLQLERHAVGFDLIKNLTRQSLRGELSLHNDEGAVAVIRFPAQA